MFIKIVWYDEFERKTLECVVADGNAAWGICHALDQCDTVRQWRLDIPEIHLSGIIVTIHGIN